MLYELSMDGLGVRGWMDDLRTSGMFELDDLTFGRLRREMVGDWVDNETCLSTIGRVYKERKYLIDPHTAVAWEVADRHARDLPMLVVSPAHWSKFPADVMRALRGLHAGEPLPEDDLGLLDQVPRLAPGNPVPAGMDAMRSRPVRFSNLVEGDRQSLESAIRAFLTSSARS